MNRCKSTGLPRLKPTLSDNELCTLRKKIDEKIEENILRWQQSVPKANYHEEVETFNLEHYKRGLIETIWRIRLLRVIESRAIAEIAKLSPDAAQIWAQYEYDEMLHDEMFMQDLIKINVDRSEVLATEPYLSTKLLTGFFSYLLDHEGPLGVVAYSYLVEYCNVRLEPVKLAGLEKILGKDKIRGQVAHANTDKKHDHTGMVWSVMRYLVTSEEDYLKIEKYLDEFQEILAMFFRELNDATQQSTIKHTEEAYEF